MKVCRLTGETFPPFSKISSGLAPNYYYLCKIQSKLGVKNTLVAGGYPKYPKKEKIDGFNVIRIDNSVPYRIFTAPILNYFAWKEIKKLDFDVLHIHNPYGIWIQKFFKKRLGKPIVVSIHGCASWNIDPEYIPMSFSPIKNLIERINSKKTLFELKMACKNADSVICISKAVAKDVIELFDLDKHKVKVVYNGFSSDIFYPRKKLNLKKIYDTDFIILYVGALKMTKGIKYLLKSLSFLKGRFNLKLLIIGDKKNIYKEYTKKISREYGVENMIHFLGEIPNIKLPIFYSSADIFVLPSVSEGLGKVALEAMACGTPVIASNVGGIPEVIDNGKNGILIPPKNPEKLADSIEMLIRNEKLRYRLSDAGLKKSKEFSWEKTAKGYIEVYKKLF